VRVAAYAGAIMPISSLLSFVPVLRFLPGLYGLYLVAVGLIAIHAADRTRTYVVTGILAVLLCIFGVMSMLATRAVQQMGADMQGQFGPNSQFQRDMEKARQEMQKAAEEMRRQQQEQQQQQQK
jgi:hypothetical protein